MIPDRSETATSEDGGIIWTEVPTGTYRVITESPSNNFASFLATCEPGRIVNANPPWGAYELTSKEKPLAAGIVAGQIVGVGHGTRRGRQLVIVSTRTAERLQAKLVLRQGNRVVGRRNATLEGFDKTKLHDVAHSGATERITVSLTDAGGETVERRFLLSDTDE